MRVLLVALAILSSNLSRVSLASSGFTDHSRPGPLAEYTAEFFSYQNAWNGPLQSHSALRLKKIVNGVVTDVVDISWLPCPGYFHGRRSRLPLLRVVPGCSYSMEQTYSIAAQLGVRVSSHGIFGVSEALFEAGRARLNTLRSGLYAYKLLDRRSQSYAINCIHAISGIYGYLNTGLSRGYGATQTLLNFFLSTGQMWRGTTTRSQSYSLSANQSSPAEGAERYTADTAIDSYPPASDFGHSVVGKTFELGVRRYLRKAVRRGLR